MRKIHLLLPLLWMAVIFMLSHQPASVSSGQSGVLSKFKFNRPAMLSIIVCALYAASDEFHQLFIIGRSGELRDIMIDSCAAIVGVFIISIFVRILQKSKK